MERIYERIVCWLLMMMALAVFVPAVLAPVHARYRQLYREEYLLEQRNQQLQTMIEEQDVVIAALDNDRTYNEYIAMRQLGYQRPGETIIPITPIAPPPELSRIDHCPEVPSWWGDHPAIVRIEAIFTDATRRSVLLVMAGVAMVVAVGLFTPGPSPRR